MLNIKAGDMVRLKSGGPIMTVKQVGNHGETQSAFCVWFDKDKKKIDDVFPLDTLQIATAPSGTKSSNAPRSSSKPTPWG